MFVTIGILKSVHAEIRMNLGNKRPMTGFIYNSVHWVSQILCSLVRGMFRKNPVVLLQPTFAEQQPLWLNTALTHLINIRIIYIYIVSKIGSFIFIILKIF